MKKNKPLLGALTVIGKDSLGRKLTAPVKPVVNGVNTNNPLLKWKKTTVKKCKENTERYMDAANKELSVAHEMYPADNDQRDEWTRLMEKYPHLGPAR